VIALRFTLMFIRWLEVFAHLEAGRLTSAWALFGTAALLRLR